MHNVSKRSRAHIYLTLLAASLAACGDQPDQEPVAEAEDAASGSGRPSPSGGLYSWCTQWADTTPNTIIARGAVRLMTYNVKMIPESFPFDIGSEAEFAMDHEDRAPEVAAKVRAAGADIVAFNEVFDGDGQDALVEALHDDYPYFVYFVDDTNDVLSDSGLMLFSKYPFAQFSLPTIKDGEARACANGVRWNHDAVNIFEKGAGEDDLANKGVAMVRIRLPENEYLNVAFTHLQADNKPESISIRASQMAEIENLLRGQLTPTQLTTEHVFVIGDLNIDGSAGATERNEWTRFFEPGAPTDQLFFECGGANPCVPSASRIMTDGWEYETVETDIGQTHGNFHLFDDPSRGSRYDYILHNRASSPNYCFQHYRRGTDWFLLNNMRMSDHMAVAVDMQRQTTACSPLQAVSVTGDIFNYPGGITYPGSVQWFEITEDAAGTYSFGVTSNVGFEIFADEDLSRPLVPFSKTQDPRRPWKYLLSDPPYYVRVFGGSVDPYGNTAENRAFQGTYTFRVKKHNCRSPENSCALLPTINSAASWPANNIVNSIDALWFDFYSEYSTKQEIPTMRFEVDPQSVFVADYEATIHHTSAGQPQIPSGSVGLETADVGTNLHVTMAGLAGTSGGPRLYHLRLRRLEVTSYAQPVEVTEFTNLTYFKPVRLHCGLEDDVAGDDEIYGRVLVDEGDWWEITTPWTWLGDYATDSEGDPSAMGNVSYLNWVQPQLLESDDAFNGDSNVLDPMTSPAQVYPLEEHLYKSVEEYTFDDGDETYEYILRYERRHDHF